MYEGIATVFGTLISDIFGSKNYATNMSILGQAITLSAITSAWLAAFGTSWGFGKIFTLTAGLSLVGLVAALVLRKMRINNIEIVKKQKEEPESKGTEAVEQIEKQE